MITATQEDYEALAVELATNPERLAEIERRLNRDRLAKPLFDTELFTRHLEEAYQQMYDRYQNDLPPDHIFIQPASWSSRQV